MVRKLKWQRSFDIVTYVSVQVWHYEIKEEETISRGKVTTHVRQKLANLTCTLSSAKASVTPAGALLLSKAAVDTFNPALNCWTESRYSRSGLFKHSDTTSAGFNELILGAMMYSTIKNALFNGTLAEASGVARLAVALAGWDVQVAVTSTAHAARVPRHLWWQTLWCMECHLW